MRYIFFTLLAVNLAVLLYGQFQQPAETPRRVSVRHPAGTDTLFLLSENSSGADFGFETARERANRVINSPVRSDLNNPTESVCLAIGPFSDLFSGQDILDQLNALDIAGQLRAVDQATGASDYRVMIPPASSLQDAFRKLRELKSRNIDSYVITEGEGALGISLGVFSSEQAARSAQLQREREGYPTTIIEIPRLAREFWIFGADNQSLDLEPALWQSLVRQSNGLEQRLLSCPANASGD